jgi:cell division protein FtsL
VRDEGVVLIGKPIDNSRVVRRVDPRSRREVWLLIALVFVLVGALCLYAWPTLELRRAGQQGVELSREKERLLEQKRKLQLEKAALENLGRVETIAVRQLGLKAPAPEQSVVVELPRTLPPEQTIAGATAPKREARVDAEPAEARP